jgi:hypothetical protein
MYCAFYLYYSGDYHQAKEGVLVRAADNMATLELFYLKRLAGYKVDLARKTKPN